MKKLIIALLLISGFSINAQTVDDIINSYFENTGGKDNWNKIEGIYNEGVMKMQGMEIPFKSYQFKDGHSAQIANFQGKEMTFLAFDGKDAWGINFMNNKAEKKNEETIETLKNATKEFPSPFLNYQDKGFKISLEGEEELEGTAVYKIKLVKDSVTLNGQKYPSIEYIYFDKENFVPIMKEAAIPIGPMAGQVAKTYIGDYREINGLYFPFEMTSKINGQVMQSMVFEKFEINPELKPEIFKFPEIKEQPIQSKEEKQDTVKKQ